MSVLINASTSTGLVQSADTSGEIELQSNGTTALKVNTNEGIQILNCLGVGNATPSTSGAGITFPATASASTNANTLDDYEEGTFTPTLFGGTTAGSVTSGTITGIYTKIGCRVFIGIRVDNVTLSGAAGIWQIGNLPFTVLSDPTQQGFFVPMTYNVNFTTTSISGFYSSGNTLTGFECVSGAPWTAWNVTNGSNLYFNLNLNYVVA